MRRHAFPLSALLVLTACARPEVAALKVNQTPIRIVVSLPASVENRAAAERLVAEALRTELGGRLRLVPEGAEASADTVTLAVTVAYKGVSPARDSVGAGLGGDAMGTAYALGKGKSIAPAAGDGLLTGLVFGTLTYAGETARVSYHARRLGYEPRFATCQIELLEADGRRRAAYPETDAWEVVKAMKSMKEQLEPQAIAKEEARALAEVVGRRLAKSGA